MDAHRLVDDVGVVDGCLGVFEVGDAGGVEGAKLVAEVAVAGDVLVAEAEDGEVAGGVYALLILVGDGDDLLVGEGVKELCGDVGARFDGGGALGGEGVGGEGLPAGVLADVGFFEETGAVVFDDAIEEVSTVSS